MASTAMADAGDRRHAPRARFSGIALVRAEDYDINCVGGDISASGMLLYPTQPPPVLPTHLRVTFALPGSSEWLVVEAELVRQKRLARRTVWAVRFISMSQEARAQLLAYINEAELRGDRVAPPPGPERSTLRPVSRARPEGDREPAPRSPGSRRGSSGVLEIPVREADYVEDAISIEALPADPETVTLPSEEVDQLAAASLAVDLEGLEPADLPPLDQPGPEARPDLPPLRSGLPSPVSTQALPPPPPLDADEDDDLLDDEDDDEVDTQVVVEAPAAPGRKPGPAGTRRR